MPANAQSQVFEKAHGGNPWRSPVQNNSIVYVPGDNGLSDDVPQESGYGSAAFFYAPRPCPAGTTYCNIKKMCVHTDVHTSHSAVHSLAQYDHSDLNPTGCQSQLHPVDQRYVPVGRAVKEVRACDAEVPFPKTHSVTETEFNTDWLSFTSTF